MPRRKAFIFGRVIITTVMQGAGAPIFDRCGGSTDEGAYWKGRTIYWRFWHKDQYGQRLPLIIPVIGITEKINSKKGNPMPDDEKDDAAGPKPADDSENKDA